jgi:GNAT superfamily N-acetyltransferase
MRTIPAKKLQITGIGDGTFRCATAADVAAIVRLVNSAYRGKSSRAGWTTEADLLGGQRTDKEEISCLIGLPDSMLLLCLGCGEILGSLHLQKINTVTTYLGMLVVKPGLQGLGIGSHFMNRADEIARSEWGTVKMQIQVITLRHELIAYYLRRGYRRTGEIRPFPVDNPKFGLPKVTGLTLEVLEKSLLFQG